MNSVDIHVGANYESHDGTIVTVVGRNTNGHWKVERVDEQQPGGCAYAWPARRFKRRVSRREVEALAATTFEAAEKALREADMTLGQLLSPCHCGQSLTKAESLRSGDTASDQTAAVICDNCGLAHEVAVSAVPALVTAYQKKKDEAKWQRLVKAYTRQRREDP